MLGEYEELRNEIRHLRIINKNYLGAISKCNDYLKILNDEKNKNVNNEKWFCYHNMALSNKKTGNFQVAIKNELLAINNTKGNYDSKYYSSIWLIAECHICLGNVKEALDLYKECSIFYKSIEEENLRICITWNKAKIFRSIKAMLKIIKIYEKDNLNSIVKTYGDMEYDDILTEMYTDLFNLYFETDKQRAFNLLYILKDKSLRRELSKQLKAA